MDKDIFKSITAIELGLVGLMLLAIALSLISQSKVINSILFFSLLGLYGIFLIYRGIRGIRYQDITLPVRFARRIKGKTAVFFGRIFLLLGLMLVVFASIGILSVL